MKEIRDYMMENMPVPAQLEYLHEVYVATNLCDFVKTEMERAWNPFKAAYLTMERVYQIPIGNAPTTDEILQLDSQRDQLAHAIDIAVESALKSIDPEMVAAAKALAQTKISFPIDPKKGYLSQTSQIDFYVSVMLGDQLANTTKVGVLPLVQMLKSINDHVHTLISERGEERAVRGNDPSRPEARSTAIYTWRTLVKYVNGYNLVVLGGTEPNASLDSYIDLMNEKTDRFHSIYLGPSSSNKPTEGGEGAEGEEGEEGEEEQQPTQFTITFTHNGQTVSSMELEAGAAITPPAAPSGYHWVNVPATMPAENVTIHSEEDEEEEPPILS